MRLEERTRNFYQVIIFFSYLVLAHAYVTNTEFIRIANADLEDLYVHTQQTTLLDSLASCSVLCSQSVGCKSFTWKNVTFSCVLLSTEPQRRSGGPYIPRDIELFVRYYRSCTEFGYDEINGISGYCFKDYAISRTYSEAQNICQNDGGHLLGISTSTKHGYIKSFMILKSRRSIVIDGTDLVDGTWRLSDGNPMFLNWREGEPSGGNEHCVMMLDDGVQNDILCTASMNFICERQLII